MTGWLAALVTTLTSSDTEAGESTLDPKAILEQVYGHLTAHNYSEEPLFRLAGLPIYWNNHLLALLVASGLAILMFGSLALSLRRHGRARGPLMNVLEAGVLFVRDDMIYAKRGGNFRDRQVPVFKVER